MDEAVDLYATETELRQSEWLRLRASLAEQEHHRARRDLVLMAWGIVLAFGLALASAAEALGLVSYVPRELPLWIFGLVGIASLTTIIGLLLQYRVLREHTADITLRREIEHRLDQLDRHQG